MLGKTHEVTAPTGLLKVMESAVVQAGTPRSSTTASFSGVCTGLHTHCNGTEAGCSGLVSCQAPATAPSGPPRGSPMQHMHRCAHAGGGWCSCPRNAPTAHAPGGPTHVLTCICG